MKTTSWKPSHQPIRYNTLTAQSQWSSKLMHPRVALVQPCFKTRAPLNIEANSWQRQSQVYSDIEREMLAIVPILCIWTRRHFWDRSQATRGNFQETPHDSSTTNCKNDALGSEIRRRNQVCIRKEHPTGWCIVQDQPLPWWHNWRAGCVCPWTALPLECKPNQDRTD